MDYNSLKKRRIEAAEMKLLRPLAGYTLYDHKTNDYILKSFVNPVVFIMNYIAVCIPV